MIWVTYSILRSRSSKLFESMIIMRRLAELPSRYSPTATSPRSARPSSMACWASRAAADDSSICACRSATWAVSASYSALISPMRASASSNVAWAASTASWLPAAGSATAAVGSTPISEQASNRAIKAASQRRPCRCRCSKVSLSFHRHECAGDSGIRPKRAERIGLSSRNTPSETSPSAKKT